jgi:Tol biopolymer transport system component
VNTGKKMNTRTNRIVAVALAGLLMPGTSSAQTKPAVELEGAIAREQVSGDLKAAISAYQKIAANSAAPREVRAKALLHLAGCYEKQGGQAQSVYRQIVRDYADQPAAKQASAKLAAMRPAGADGAPTGMTLRKIEVPASLEGARPDFANTDGRHIVYSDPKTGALALGDLVTGESRTIYKPKPGTVVAMNQNFASRDFSMVLSRMTLADGTFVSAVMKMDGSGYREIKGDGRPDWAWDGNSILLFETTSEGPQRLGKVSVSDGSFSALGKPQGLVNLGSPDGRFIASVPSVNYGRVLLGPAGSSQPQQVLDDAKLLDWTRDGRYLIVAMNRSGAEALYALPVKEGKAAGDPIFIRYGSFLIARTTANGQLIFEQVPQEGKYENWLGQLDANGRVSGWKQLNLPGNTGILSWSPDSSQIAYVSSNESAGQSGGTVRLHNVATGDERELYHAASGEMGCVWASKSANLFCTLHTSPTSTEVMSISTESGRVEPMGSMPGDSVAMFAGRDDRSIYMTLRPNSEMVRFEIATRQVTSLGRARGTMVGYDVASPDERWISRVENGRAEARPMAGGEWKLMYSGRGSQMAFAPDGNWFYYHGRDEASKQGFYRVPSGGGKAERLGDFPSANRVGLMNVSPDGRQVVAEAQKALDTWVLENFEPKR